MGGADRKSEMLGLKGISDFKKTVNFRDVGVVIDYQKARFVLI